jgi:hypothetical protein
MKVLSWLASIAIVLIVGGFAFLGLSANDDGYLMGSAEPEVVTQTEYIDRYIEKPVYVEIEKSIYVEREVEVPVMLKDWNSVEELEEFLANDDTEEHIILTAGSDGKINFDGQCEDFALQLRDRAMAINKYLSVIALHPEEYRKWYGKQLKSNEYHAICMARIGNEFWYIEPATDKHWLALYLD